METINHLNQQLHDCQKQYSDLLTNKSNDTFQQLTRMTEDKQKLEQTCEELQVLSNLSLVIEFFVHFSRKFEPYEID